MALQGLSGSGIKSCGIPPVSMHDTNDQQLR